MKLVLDDAVRVGEGLVLRGKRISGMKELIDSILHDWSVDDWVRLGQASQQRTRTTRTHQPTLQLCPAPYTKHSKTTLPIGHVYPLSLSFPLQMEAKL